VFPWASKRAATFDPKGPEGRLIYAIGDVHGRADRLTALVELIRQDVQRAGALSLKPTLMLLGDYIDRGPHSREVIDIILALEADPLFQTIALRGNHDQFLLDFLEDGSSGGAWLQYGGGATLASYGVVPPRQRSDQDGWRQTAQALNQALPPEHLDFFNRTRLGAVLGDFVFVHAGVRPGTQLEDQDPWDVMSIRKPFLASREPMAGKVVVFGHTAMEAPLVERHKIGVDTGAYATGVLTALRIFEGERGFINTAPVGAALAYS
jgi:serine/threonine protein phosphatase 1